MSNKSLEDKLYELKKSLIDLTLEYSCSYNKDTSDGRELLEVINLISRTIEICSAKNKKIDRKR